MSPTVQQRITNTCHWRRAKKTKLGHAFFRAPNIHSIAKSFLQFHSLLSVFSLPPCPSSQLTFVSVSVRHAAALSLDLYSRLLQVARARERERDSGAKVGQHQLLNSCRVTRKISSQLRLQFLKSSFVNMDRINLSRKSLKKKNKYENILIILESPL